ncbi:hypothetical protein Fmac_004946 [Flemingia macrophylla]|uniref:Transmembrane protein n=1 Tax=Flemingia macrophylla TaxID=520843 RepID=A0ABD1N6D0_9FABA
MDTSRHCASFIGLQRKHGEVVQEVQQFDIRWTVNKANNTMIVGWYLSCDFLISFLYLWFNSAALLCFL